MSSETHLKRRIRLVLLKVLAIFFFILFLLGNVFLFATRHKIAMTSRIAPTHTPTPNVVCSQVIVHARNPQNGQCEQFGSPCDVPTGWKIENCAAVSPVFIPQK